jgi:hypothetical protein
MQFSNTASGVLSVVLNGNIFYAKDLMKKIFDIDTEIAHLASSNAENQPLKYQ